MACWGRAALVRAPRQLARTSSARGAVFSTGFFSQDTGREGSSPQKTLDQAPWSAVAIQRRRRRRQEQQNLALGDGDNTMASVPAPTSVAGQRRGAEFAWTVGPELTGGESRETLYLRRMKLAHFRSDFREATRLLSEMDEEGVHVDGRVYHLVLGVLFSGMRWREVLGVFDKLKSAGLKPGLDAYNTAIMACANCNDADRAEGLLREMPAAGLVPARTTYTGVLLAYGYRGRWADALSLFDEMMEAGVTPDEKAYRAVIDACGAGRQWERASQLFREMASAGISPGTMSYRALVTACRKSEQW